LHNLKIELGQSYPQAIVDIPSLEKAYWRISLKMAAGTLLPFFSASRPILALFLTSGKR
jgi:hypothetical protein